jgi:hypothetical protein
MVAVLFHLFLQLKANNSVCKTNQELLKQVSLTIVTDYVRKRLS